MEFMILDMDEMKENNRRLEAECNNKIGELEV